MNTTGIVPTMPIGGNGFGFGGDGIWALLIFAMIFNNGFGFGNGANNLATQDYVSSEFTQQAINNGFALLFTTTVASIKNKELLLLVIFSTHFISYFFL